MSKNSEYFNIGVTADITDAKRSFAELQTLVGKLAQNPYQPEDSVLYQYATQARQASKEIVSLQSALIKTVNVNTGKLNLVAFNNQIKQANLSFEQLASTFNKLGSQGTKAFEQLCTQIKNAEVPLKETNALIEKMKDALLKSAKWQISNSAIRGLWGGLQSAYYYAQDLNKSLNDIRIVSGNSAEEMAKFASRANEAAKALNTTTTRYTDAALIFYQQGLPDADVKERTDAVIKLSNVTGQASDDVSSYMTAIWNNFYDGSESIESFADKITALGAATAASSEEIANGLGKFSAIAETVGLSYDYAATALATVVAQTRQSADTVGTAFKTLFARLQGLKLGETLEDGTDLNKYSEALATIGISIKESNGQMKNMDKILSEMGDKWQTLGQDTKIAVAQAVAGTRQYSYMMALMDNWDKFQNNLLVTQNAEGTLQRQADIYAESWEAAEKRVKASFEGLFQTLLDDKFFINITQSVASTVEWVDKLVNNLGGVKTVLEGIGFILLTTFSKNISGEIDRIVTNIKNSFIFTKQELASLQTKAAQYQLKEAKKSGDQENVFIFEKELSILQQIDNTKATLKQKGLEITDIEEEHLKNLQEQNKALQEQFRLANSAEGISNLADNVTRGVYSKDKQNYKFADYYRNNNSAFEMGSNHTQQKNGQIETFWQPGIWEKAGFDKPTLEERYYRGALSKEEEKANGLNGDKLSADIGKYFVQARKIAFSDMTRQRLENIAGEAGVNRDDIITNVQNLVNALDFSKSQAVNNGLKTSYANEMFTYTKSELDENGNKQYKEILPELIDNLKNSKDSPELFFKTLNQAILDLDKLAEDAQIKAGNLEEKIRKATGGDKLNDLEEKAKTGELNENQQKAYDYAKEKQEYLDNEFNKTAEDMDAATETVGNQIDAYMQLNNSMETTKDYYIII